MIIFSLAILFCYAALILFLILGINKVPVFNTKDNPSKNSFTVIVPFRNEAANLPVLLQSILELNYPKEQMEFLFVNDDSTDDFMKVFKENALQENISYRILENIRESDAPKKDAIQTAISQASFDWIITTDADCTLPKNWLKSFDQCIENNVVKMIVAPVTLINYPRFFYAFQTLDFLSLQGTTLGGFGNNLPFLCNGANLCYHKPTFFKLNGFEGNKHIASGDDIFLMEKFLNYNKTKVAYLKCKDAIVQTQPKNTLKALLQQRIRWASKTSSSQKSTSKRVGLLVFITNFYLILLFFLALFNQINWMHLGLFYLVKLNIDFVLLFHTATFFQQEKLMKYYIWSSLVHPLFISYTAFLSLRKKYNWKDRAFHH